MHPLPTILPEKGHRAREPYPLDASEQELLFGQLTQERRRPVGEDLFAFAEPERCGFGSIPRHGPRSINGVEVSE
jgi:hypothetical protein